ncbi:MAG: hypothetical protein JNM17_27780 [Archangium sp.]|nr:hypothetical protein [Archangium sp.]
MIPVGGIVAAIVIAIRAINAAQNKDGATTTSSSGVVQTSRGSSTFWSDPGAGGTIVWQLILLGMAFAGTGIAMETASGVALTFGLLGWWLLLPAWFARVVFAPLGMVRLAYFSCQFSRVTWRRDKPGGPAMIAAWGLAQQDKPSPSTIAWLEKVLSANKHRALQASGVVARGLLEAAKGNKEAARQWLDSVLLFDPRVAPSHVRVVAAEWLATDAAARADWKRVKDIAKNPKWAASAQLHLLGAVAGRMLGDAMPTTAGLWMWWLFAPRRLWTFSFVRKAAAMTPQPQAPEGALPDVPAELDAISSADASAGAVARATFLTLALKQGAPSATAVINVARTWERALDNELRSKLFARSMLIGGGEPDEAISEVRQLIEAELGKLLPAKLSGTHGDLPALIDTAVQSRREQLNNELEDKMRRMDDRKVNAREIPQLEEWHDFMLLRALYRQAVDTASNQGDVSLSHSIIRDKLVNFAVWLYNVRNEKPVANAIFRMLETEAVVLGDADAEKLNKKNAACDL